MGEYSGAGSPIKETIWLPGQNGGTAIPVLVVDKDSKVYDVFSGHLNEPVIVAAQSGDKVWKWDHDPSGTTAPQETFEVGNGANLGDDGRANSDSIRGCFISSLFSAAAAEAADATTTFFEYNLRLPGQVFDKETNFSHNNARVYLAAKGIFNRYDPMGLKAGLNPFAYVGGNPVMGVDPWGLDTYIVNRDLDVFGSSSRSRWNIVTHTFVVVTNSAGTVAATYSWGNDANLQGWSLNQTLDVNTARQALKNGEAEWVGGSDLDPHVRDVYDIMNNSAFEHPNYWLDNNCKVEAHRIVDFAKQSQSDEKMRVLRNTLGLN